MMYIGVLYGSSVGYEMFLLGIVLLYVPELGLLENESVCVCYGFFSISGSRCDCVSFVLARYS